MGGGYFGDHSFSPIKLMIKVFKNSAIALIMGVLAIGGVALAKEKKMKIDDLGRAWLDRLEYVGIAVTEPGYHVWGSSPVVGDDGRVHLFVARWPVSAKFLPGWHTSSEIARYVSDSPEGPFRFQEVVLKGKEPDDSSDSQVDSWDQCAPHNPTIHQVGDRYVLMYIANTGDDFPASQNIGMLISKSLEGPWVKAGKDGMVLTPPDDPSVWSHKSEVGVNNPALLQHPDGRFLLYYKAKRKGDGSCSYVFRIKEAKEPSNPDSETNQ